MSQEWEYTGDRKLGARLPATTSAGERTPMSEQTFARDSRATPTRRRIVLTIDDYTHVAFSQIDQELMAENIEDLLRRQYDVNVDLIEIEDVKP